MYLFKLKAYLSSIKGNYRSRYETQPSPEWPLSVGSCGRFATIITKLFLSASADRGLVSTVSALALERRRSGQRGNVVDLPKCLLWHLFSSDSFQKSQNGGEDQLKMS